VSDTIRQLICENILTRLKTISKSGGYSIDYPTIAEWKLSALPPAELPAITLRDESCDVVIYDRDNTVWNLHVTIIVSALGEESQEDLRNYINDVYKCIGADIFCGGHGEIKPEGDAMTMEQHEDVYGDIEIKFSILFETKSWDLTAKY
jgi:hypothetical protein